MEMEILERNLATVVVMGVMVVMMMMTTLVTLMRVMMEMKVVFLGGLFSKRLALIVLFSTLLMHIFNFSSLDDELNIHFSDF